MVRVRVRGTARSAQPAAAGAPNQLATTVAAAGKTGPCRG